MVKEKNIVEMLYYNLKENILMENHGMERDIIKMAILNILLNTEEGM